MASSEVQRKLTAILVADVVGYSRLMGGDGGSTVEKTLPSAKGGPNAAKNSRNA